MVIDGGVDSDGGDSFDAFLEIIASGTGPAGAPAAEEAPAAPTEAGEAAAVGSDVERGENDVVHEAEGRSNIEMTSRPSAPIGNGHHQQRSRRALRRASTTEERRNPFAVREGNLLTWREVSMTLVSALGRGGISNAVAVPARIDSHDTSCVISIFNFDVPHFTLRRTINRARGKFSVTSGARSPPGRSRPSWALPVRSAAASPAWLTKINLSGNCSSRARAYVGPCHALPCDIYGTPRARMD